MNLDPFVQRILDRLANRISELELDKAYLETRIETMQTRIDELNHVIKELGADDSPTVQEGNEGSID